MDFIDYAQINMTWWGFNSMKTVIPTFLLIYTEYVNSDSTVIESRKDNISYLPLVCACLIMSIIQFVATPRIFLADFMHDTLIENIFTQKNKQDAVDPPILNPF